MGNKCISKTVDVVEDIEYNIVMDGSSSVNQTANNSFIFYPNPVKDKLFVKVTDISASAEYEIININGSILQKGSISPDLSEINLTSLTKGFYFIKIHTNNNIITESFIKN